MRAMRRRVSINVAVACAALLIVFAWSLKLSNMWRHRSPSLIPHPAQIEPQNGSFALASTTPILLPAGNDEALHIARFLADHLQETRGMKLPVRMDPAA